MIDPILDVRLRLIEWTGILQVQHRLLLRWYLLERSRLIRMLLLLDHLNIIIAHHWCLGWYEDGLRVLPSGILVDHVHHLNFLLGCICWLTVHLVSQNHAAILRRILHNPPVLHAHGVASLVSKSNVSIRSGYPIVSEVDGLSGLGIADWRMVLPPI